jgi:hypothetical protein
MQAPRANAMNGAVKNDRWFMTMERAWAVPHWD